MKKALIYVGKEEFKDAIGILEVLRRMYLDEKVYVYALFVNDTGESAKGYVDEIINLSNIQLTDYDISALCQSVSELQMEMKFDSIIIPATNVGRLLAPRLAMRLKVGLVADVTNIYSDGKEIEMVRPAFDGKVLAGIVSTGKVPLMMSVRAGAFTYSEAIAKETVFKSWQPVDVKKGNIRLLSSQEKEVSKDIRDSQVLVSGGGGIKENFAKIEPLAKELKGMVAASRSIVDSGLANRAIQVGQSGKTVSPKLYIALGIYGSMQHFEGLRDVNHIISVNTNKSAPLCSVSDIVVEGDAYEFVEKLLERIEQGKNKY